MVSTTIYKQLSFDEQAEFQALSSKFIRAVENSGARDGIDFAYSYQIKSTEGAWFIAHNDSNEPLAGITSNSKTIVEALFSDAVQNYGR